MRLRHCTQDYHSTLLHAQEEAWLAVPLLVAPPSSLLEGDAATATTARSSAPNDQFWTGVTSPLTSPISTASLPTLAEAAAAVTRIMNTWPSALPPAARRSHGGSSTPSSIPWFPKPGRLSLLASLQSQPQHECMPSICELPLESDAFPLVTILEAAHQGLCQGMEQLAAGSMVGDLARHHAEFTQKEHEGAMATWYCSRHQLCKQQLTYDCSRSPLTQEPSDKL